MHATGDFDVSYAQAKANPLTRSNTVIGAAKNGLHLVRVCDPKELQWGYYNNGEFVAVSPGSARLIRLRPIDITKILPLPTVHRGDELFDQKSQGAQVFYNRYDTSLYKPDTGEGNQAQVSIVPGNAASSDTKQNIYYSTGFFRDNQFIPTDHNLGLRFTTKATQACQVVERDISCPVVRVNYDPESGMVTGRIHDFGTPLSLLDVSFTGRSDHSNAHPYKNNLPFEFVNGHFSGKFIPPEQGEFFINPATMESVFVISVDKYKTES
jgi:hypothetical protein